jgi:uncharacterized membrane protein YdjX (TVP38/TMEM64 family)
LFWLLLIVFLGGGFVFKLLWGFCVVWLGATIGTVILHVTISEYSIISNHRYHKAYNKTNE